MSKFLSIAKSSPPGRSSQKEGETEGRKQIIHVGKPESTTNANGSATDPINAFKSGTAHTTKSSKTKTDDKMMINVGHHF